MNTSQRPSVLILGANGRLGLAAAQAFDAAGWQVLAQVRRNAAACMPAGVRLVQAQLNEPDALAAQAAGAQVVVYALNPVYTRWAQEAMPMAVAGMDLAQRLGARFMLPGNVYNFGTQMPALLCEDTPQRADTRKGRIRVAIEAEMARRCGAGTLRATVLRAGDFFGSGAGSWFDLVIAKSVAQGKLAYPGPLDVPHAWAYLPDLARAFVAAAQTHGLPAFATLHFAGYTLTGAQLLAGIERAAAGLGLAPPGGFRQGGMPWGVIRLGGLVVPMWRELAEMAYLWTVPHALAGSAPQTLLLPAATPIDLALRAALVALQPAPPTVPVGATAR
jgi:nucleoside-diphosphate-sugar epimerase